MVKFPKYRKFSIVEGIGALFLFMASFYVFVYFHAVVRFIVLLFVMIFIGWIIYMYRLLFKWKVTIVDDNGIHEEIYGLNFKEPKRCRTIILWDVVYEVELIPQTSFGEYRPCFICIRFYLNNRQTDYLIIYTEWTSLNHWKREKYDPKIFEELSKILNDRKIKFKF